MTKVIKDWNRNEVKPGDVFHFKNSLRAFIEIYNNDTPFFLNIDSWECYEADPNTLECESLFFLEKEDDEDFLGVEVVGRIESWF